MRITPLDIQQKQFQMNFRGFHAEEVLAFLEILREEMEDLLRENASLKDRIYKIDEETNKFRVITDSLGRMLQEAQERAEEFKVHGKNEAASRIEKADDEARAMVRRAHLRALQLSDEISALRDIRTSFHKEMREIIRQFKKITDEVQKEEMPLKQLDEFPGQEAELEILTVNEELLLPEEEQDVIEGDQREEKSS